MSEKIKQYSFRYAQENLNDYEKIVIIALNDWHTPQLRNAMAYTNKVNANGCINQYHTTFLHYAAAKQDSMNEKSVSPLTVLIEAGADIFAQDSDGLTPYDYAKIKEHRVNQVILKKAFEVQKEKYNNAKEVLKKIENKEFLRDIPENQAEVQVVRQLVELKRNNLALSQKRDFTEPERELLNRFKGIKRILTDMEFERFSNTVEKFEKNQLIWNGL